MKKLILVALAITSVFSFAQQDVYLRILHQWGGQPFSYGSPTAITAGDDVTINRLEYYISGIEVTHDGGQVLSLDTIYTLVDAQNTTQIYLGDLPVTTLESVAFSVGVDNGSNHLDPASFNMSHPLAPKSPSMHWGWAAGYRFVAIEGTVGSNKDAMEIHALGDANYFRQDFTTAGTLVNGDLIVQLDAEYIHSFGSINVTGGLIFHGESGLAVTYLENFRDSVFTESTEAVSGIGIEEEQVSADFTIQPNPAVNGKSTIQLSQTDDATITIIDVTGREVYHNEVTGVSEVNVELQTPGVYLVRVINGSATSTQRLIVQ